MAGHVAGMVSVFQRPPEDYNAFFTISQLRSPDPRHRKGFEGIRYQSITTRPDPCLTCVLSILSNPVSLHKVVLGLAVAFRTLGSDLRQLRVSEIQTPIAPLFYAFVVFATELQTLREPVRRLRRARSQTAASTTGTALSRAASLKGHTHLVGPTIA